MNLNRVQIIGRTTRKPELKQTTSGMKVCQFSMATNNNYKRENGEKIEETDFHNIVAFGKQAEILAQYVEQGQILFVEGRLKTSSWEDKEDGKKRYKTDIMMSSFQFGPRAGEGKRPVGETSTIEGKGMDTDSTDYGDGLPDPDDIPF